MANQQIEIKLVIAEEVSRQLSPIASEIKNIHAAAASGADRVHAGMGRLGGAVRVVHREFSSLTRLTLGGLVGGGVVAGIVAATKALGDMARQSQQLRYQAEALGTTPEFLERMSDGLLALGVDASTASRDVQSVMSTLRDAEVHGRGSSLFKALEHGVRGTGLKLWADIKRQMAGPEGAEGAFKYLIGRIQNMPLSGQRAMLKALGISSLAFKDLKEVLPFLHKRIQLSADETRKLSIANANFEIEMGNIGRILGSAVMPGIEKVTTAFAKFLQTESGKKLAADLREWSDALGTSIAKWINDEGPTGLKANVEDLKKAVAALKQYFVDADKVITDMGGSWTGVFKALVGTTFVLWLGSLLTALRGIAPFAKTLGLLVAAYYGAKWFREWSGGKEREEVLEKGPRLEDMPGLTPEQQENLRRGPKRYFFPGGAKPKPTSGEGAPKTDDERRADIELENRQRTALLTEMKGLTEEIGHVVDHFQIGGPEGTVGSSGFGAGVSDGFQFDTTSVLGPAGGGKKHRPLPTLPSSVTQLSPIPGTQRPAQTSGQGFASWYGNRPDLGFRDREDSGRQGVREQDQGIALGSTKTLGQYNYLTDPHTGLTHVVRQTDTGPNIRTQALTDIHASQLARMGYTAKTFPNKRGIWNVAPAGFGQRGQEAAWAGRSGGFDEGENNNPILSSLAGMEKPGAFDQGGDNPIVSALAGTSGGGGGNATVDIDVGGLGQPARNPADLFKPQPLDGAIQMQNTPQETNNRLSFQ